MSKIDHILKSSVAFHDIDEVQNFLGLYKELYKITLFKPALDLMLTKMDHGLVKFYLQPKDDLNRLHGCCITSEHRFFNKILNAFVKNYKHKINIKTLTAEVMMHEMAHAVEKESKLHLQDEFSDIFKKDLANAEHSHLHIKTAIEQIILKEINLYPKQQHNSELFARFYQLLAMSKEVNSYHANFHFKLSEMINLFTGTVKWIEEILNPSLKHRIAIDIEKLTQDVIFDDNLQDFSRKHKPIHGNKVKWSNTINSIFGD